MSQPPPVPKDISDYPEFAGKLRRLRPTAAGRWTACCPGHDDKHPSFTIAIAPDDGRLLVNCKRGCTYEQICAGAGVPLSYLFPPGSWRRDRDPLKAAKFLHAYSYERPDAADPAEVELVCQVAVFVTPAGKAVKKTAVPNPRYRPDGPAGPDNNEFLFTAAPPPCLFRDPDLDRGRLIFLVDNEEDAGTLHDTGFQGTTVPLGFANFTEAHAGLLANAMVVVLPSRDPYAGFGDDTPHLDHARKAAALLLPHAKSVQVAFLRDAPRGECYGSWLAAVPAADGEDPAAARARGVEQFKAIVKAAPRLRTLKEVADLVPPLNPESERIPVYALECVGHLTADRRQALADALRLPADALAALDGLGYDPTQHCHVFPEVDPFGRVVGASRRWRTGSKANVSASKRGLTIPRGFTLDAADARPVFIVEGPSDTLAMHHAGLRVVGRPGNAAGTEYLAELLRPLPPDVPVYVCGENDERVNKKGEQEWPGRDGAAAVCRGLIAALGNPSITVLMPPAGFKDARDFLVARTESWTDRGAAFAKRCGVAGPSTEKQTAAPVELRAAEHAAKLRGKPPTADQLVELFDRACVRLGGAGGEDPTPVVVELCGGFLAALEHYNEKRRNA